MQLAFDAGIEKLAKLAGSDRNRNSAILALQDLFPNVPHVKDDIFFPTYSVRRILQSKELTGVEEAVDWRLAEWVTEAALVYIGKLAESPSSNASMALAKPLVDAGLGLRAALLLSELLADVREADAIQEKIFRLIYFAGKDVNDTVVWLLKTYNSFRSSCLKDTGGDDDLEALIDAGRTLTANACRSVEELIEIELAAENPEWDLKKLHNSGIRPPGSTTRILDGIRAGNFRMWHAITNPDFYDKQIPKSERESSRMSQLILNTAKTHPNVPENTERLKAYVLRSLSNLRIRQIVDQPKHDPLEKMDEDGAPVDGTARMIRAEWLWEELMVIRQGNFVEKFHRVETMFQQDHPELVRTYEVCLIDERTASKTIGSQALVLNVDGSTIKRRLIVIREYFARQLREEGLDVGHYERRLLSDKFENLYQLVENRIQGALGAKVGEGRRLLLTEAIQALSQDQPESFDLLKERYLDDQRPIEIARKRTLETAELKDRLQLIQENLAQRMKQIDGHKSDQLNAILNTLLQVDGDLAIPFDLLFRAEPKLGIKEIALWLGISSVQLHYLRQRISSSLSDQLSLKGFSLEDYRDYSPDQRLDALFGRILEIQKTLGGRSANVKLERQDMRRAIVSLIPVPFSIAQILSWELSSAADTTELSRLADRTVEFALAVDATFRRILEIQKTLGERSAKVKLELQDMRRAISSLSPVPFSVAKILNWELNSAVDTTELSRLANRTVERALARKIAQEKKLEDKRVESV